PERNLIHAFDERGQPVRAAGAERTAVPSAPVLRALLLAQSAEEAAPPSLRRRLDRRRRRCRCRCRRLGRRIGVGLPLARNGRGIPSYIAAEPAQEPAASAPHPFLDRLIRDRGADAIRILDHGSRDIRGGRLIGHGSGSDQADRESGGPCLATIQLIHFSASPSLRPTRRCPFAARRLTSKPFWDRSVRGESPKWECCERAPAFGRECPPPIGRCARRTSRSHSPGPVSGSLGCLRPPTSSSTISSTIPIRFAVSRSRSGS